MPYRQGQMVAGDYYGARHQGDLFGFLGKIAKGALGLIPGGSLIGTAIGALPGILKGGGTITNPIALNLPQTQNPIGATLPPPMRMLTRPRTGQVRVIPRKGAFEPTEIQTPGHGLPRRRRMNVGNAKALRRAIRRARGFEKLARKVLGFTSPRKPKGRVYFRARTKKR